MDESFEMSFESLQNKPKTRHPKLTKPNQKGMNLLDPTKTRRKWDSSKTTTPKFHLNIAHE